MSDLISRQQAIELIHTLYPSAPIMQMNRKRWEKKYKPYIEAEKALEKLPSVQLRKGKWIRHFDGNEWYWYCSSCKEQWYEEDLWMGGNSFPNFCPNCGCRMEEGDSDDR